MGGVGGAYPRRQRRLRRGGDPAAEHAVHVDGRVLPGEGLLERLERGHPRSSARAASSTACCAAAAAMLASTRANAPLSAANALRRPTSDSRSSAPARAASAGPGRSGTETARAPVAGTDGDTDGDAPAGADGDATESGTASASSVDVPPVHRPGAGDRAVEAGVPADGGEHPVQHPLLVVEHRRRERDVGVVGGPGRLRGGGGGAVPGRRTARHECRGQGRRAAERGASRQGRGERHGAEPTEAGRPARCPRSDAVAVPEVVREPVGWGDHRTTTTAQQEGRP